MKATRRDLLRGAAAGLLGAALGIREGAAAERYPPPFRTARAQFTLLTPRRDVGHVRLRGLGGAPRTLASLRGRSVLLGFWASWCPPCRHELPILHRLQAQSDAAPFAVVPVSLDRDAATAAAYIERLGLDGFESFIDPDGEVASGPRSKTATPFPLYGMPMSYVIDAAGRNAGYLTGEADWSRPEGVALLRFLAAP